jgi:hypothetical protein
MPTQGEFKPLHDALQLGACEQILPPAPLIADPTQRQAVPEQNGMPANEWRPTALPNQSGLLEIMVDPIDGDDATAQQRLLTHGQERNPSDLASFPFRTIAAAVLASRVRSARSARILLTAGTHFLNATIHLTDADAHLTIRSKDATSAAASAAVVSGGVNLVTRWMPSGRCKGCFEADLSSQGIRNILGLRRNGIREIRAR